MAIIQFENGTSVEFDGEPTPQDVEEVSQRLQTFDSSPTAPFNVSAPTTPEQYTLPVPIPEQLFKGAAKGAGSTLFGIAKLGEKAVNYFGGDIDLGEKPEFLQPKTTAEKIGYGAEQIAEFLIPSSKIAKAQEFATAGIKGAGILSKLGRTGLKAGIEAAASGGVAAAQAGEFGENAKTAAIVGGVFSLFGSALGGAKELGKPLGEKIQTTVIRPQQADIKDGFNIENVTKYKVGGSLEEMVTKVHVKLNNLAKNLATILKGSRAKVDMNSVIVATKAELVKDKAITFGSNRAIKNQLQGLRREVREVLGAKSDKIVDLFTATQIKRGAGTKGAWSFGRLEPEADAVEKVYTTFYRVLKTGIEKASKKAGMKIHNINKQISDLIPISNAALRRLPIEQRNNVISLTDGIGLFASMFDPKALAILGASKLSRSGRFGQFLINLSQKKITSGVGKRVFGP